jgi:hypothetical protein
VVRERCGTTLYSLFARTRLLGHWFYKPFKRPLSVLPCVRPIDSRDSWPCGSAPAMADRPPIATVYSRFLRLRTECLMARLRVFTRDLNGELLIVIESNRFYCAMASSFPYRLSIKLSILRITARLPERNGPSAKAKSGRQRPCDSIRDRSEPSSRSISL